MPDGTIRLYDHLDDLEMVASVLSEAHVLVTGLLYRVIHWKIIS